MNHPSVEQRDIRLHSQVALFIILTRIYHAFGPDVDVEVLEHELPQIEEFDKDIENWRRSWKPRLSKSSPGCSYFGLQTNQLYSSAQRLRWRHAH